MINDYKKDILKSVLQFLNSIDDNKECDWKSAVMLKDMNEGIVEFLNKNEIKTEKGLDFNRARWDSFKHKMRQDELLWKKHLERNYEGEDFIYWQRDDELGDNFNYVSY